MRTPSALIAASLVSLILADVALAQPPAYNQGPRSQAPFGQRPPQDRGAYRGGQPGGQPAGQYYYNGRWVDSNEWQRHGSERDRWARTYQGRRGGNDNSSSLIAGIIGFALGAAIVGSSQQAERARTADESWRASCAKRYRSFDRSSGTYMGVDGLRHYCQ